MILTNVIEFEQLEDRMLIDGKHYMNNMGEIVEVNSPNYVVAQKYCYDPKDERANEEGFFINPVWEQSVDQEKQKAIDAYTLELIEGGQL